MAGVRIWTAIIEKRTLFNDKYIEYACYYLQTNYLATWHIFRSK
jgi:hypothetical protein